jgi:hypothetical protein
MGLAEGPRANWAERGFYGSLGSAAGLLTLLAIGKGQWSLALVALAVGAGWAGAHRLGRGWLSPLAFVVLVGCAVVGLWRNMPPAGLVAAVAAALAAWDLDGFAAKLARFEPHPDQSLLVKNHLGRLLAVTGLGIILGEAALGLRLALGLGWLAGLGLLAVFILLQAVRLLGRETEEQVKKNDVG